MPALPFRYAPPYVARATFLFQTMKILAGSPVERTALLGAVDWDAPDTRRSEGWDRGGGLVQADISHIHPLSTIAQVGDEALFNEALGMAHQKSTKPVYLGERREMRAMADWVESGVLDAVASCGSPAMLKALTDVLLKRPKLTRSMGMNFESNRADPWASLAKHGDRTKPAAHYQHILMLLDRYARASQRSQMEFSNRKKPAEDGSGPLNVWEKRLRSGVYTHALWFAAKHANAPMLEAVLAIGHAPITLEAVGNALEAGGADLAEQLLSHRKGWSVLIRQPLVEVKDNAPSHMLRQPHQSREQLDLKEVLDAQRALGECASLWLGPETAALPDEYRQTQLDAADRLVMPMLDLFARFTPPHHAAAAQPGSSSTRAPEWTLCPLLLRLSAVDAPHAMAAITAQHIEGPEMGALPALWMWQTLLASPDSAWVDLQKTRISALSPEATDLYLKKLRSELETHWLQQTNWQQPPDDRQKAVPLDELAVLDTVWPLLSLPSPELTLARWLGETLKSANLPPAEEANVLSRLLDHQSGPAAGAATRSTPRL